MEELQSRERDGITGSSTAKRRRGTRRSRTALACVFCRYVSCHGTVYKLSNGIAGIERSDAQGTGLHAAHAQAERRTVFIQGSLYHQSSDGSRQLETQSPVIKMMERVTSIEVVQCMLLPHFSQNLDLLPSSPIASEDIEALTWSRPSTVLSRNHRRCALVCFREIYASTFFCFLRPQQLIEDEYGDDLPLALVLCIVALVSKYGDLCDELDSVS